MLPLRKRFYRTCPRIAQAVVCLQPYAPQLNFITIHYAYFLGVLLISSLVFWGSSEPAWSVSYTDSLYMVVSGMTETGLNTVALSALTTWQQVILYLLIVFGGGVWVSIWAVAFRKHVLEQHIDALLRTRQPDAVDSYGTTDTSFGLFLCTGGRPDRTSREREKKLGGCEYRALQLLSVVVPLYFVLWHVVGSVALGAWIQHYMPGTARASGAHPWWLGIFNAASAFNNSGMSLLDANMVPFQEAYLVLITMGLMILAGHTAYPVLLRLLFWTAAKLLDRTTQRDQCVELKTTLLFILRYPRRVYTNMFPSRPTWWLLLMLVLINSAGWLGFELLNLTNPVVQAIPTGPRILDGLFQALATRSGGFSVVAMSDLRVELLVIYVVMMYIPVYPVVLNMHRSSVYEERSLGIYTHQHVEKTTDMEEGSSALTDAPMHVTTSSTPPPSRVEVDVLCRDNGRIGFVRQQIGNLLADDLWLLALAVFLITAIESSSFLREPTAHSIFNTIFEVVSGYGCVGVSLGVLDQSYSLSGSWHASSKVILCVVMVKGRHRGLPVALDQEVQLLETQLYQDEQHTIG